MNKIINLIKYFKSSPLYVKIIIIVLVVIPTLLLSMSIFTQPAIKNPDMKIKPTPMQTQTLSPIPTSSAQNSAQCAAESGAWEAWGSGEREFCQIPAKDSGKTCTDGSQCSYGLCRSTEDTPTGTGVCAQYPTEFGCYNIIEHGKVTDKMCID